MIGLDGATLDLVAPWVAAGHAAGPRAADGARRVGAAPVDDPAGDVSGLDVARDRRQSRPARRPRLHRARAGHVPRALRERQPAARAGAVDAAVARPGGASPCSACRRRIRPEPVERRHGERLRQPARDRHRRLVRPSARVLRRDPARGRAPAVRRLPGDARPGRGWHERALGQLLDGVERRTTLARAAAARASAGTRLWSCSASRTRSRITSGASTIARSPRYAPSPFARRDPPRLPRARRGARTAGRRGAARRDGRGRLRSRQRRRRRPRRAPESPARGARAARASARRGADGRAAAARRCGAARRAASPPGRAAAARCRRRPGALEGCARFGGIDWARHGRVLGGARLPPERLAERARARARGHGRAGATTSARATTWRDALEAWRRRRRAGRSSRACWRREELYAGRPSSARPICCSSSRWSTATARRACGATAPGPALRRLAPRSTAAGRAPA